MKWWFCRILVHVLQAEYFPIVHLLSKHIGTRQMPNMHQYTHSLFLFCSINANECKQYTQTSTFSTIWIWSQHQNLDFYDENYSHSLKYIKINVLQPLNMWKIGIMSSVQLGKLGEIYGIVWMWSSSNKSSKMRFQLYEVKSKTLDAWCSICVLMWTAIDPERAWNANRTIFTCKRVNL